MKLGIVLLLLVLLLLLLVMTRTPGVNRIGCMLLRRVLLELIVGVHLRVCLRLRLRRICGPLHGEATATSLQSQVVNVEVEKYIR